MMDLQKRKTDKYCTHDQLDELCGQIAKSQGVQLDLQMPVSDSCYLVKYRGEFDRSDSKKISST